MNPASNLAQINLATNAVSAIAPAKSLADLQAELAILEAELVSNQKLINERGTRSYLVQAAQTAVLLGHRTAHDLQAAQRSLDECITALTRQPMLERAVADQHQIIEDYQHRERAEYVASIKKQFIDVMDRYKIESKKLLALHNELVSLDNKYRSLAPGQLSGLLDPFYVELNLPAVTGSLASRSGFATGSGQ